MRAILLGPVPCTRPAVARWAACVGAALVLCADARGIRLVCVVCGDESADEFEEKTSCFIWGVRSLALPPDAVRIVAAGSGASLLAACAGLLEVCAASTEPSSLLANGRNPALESSSSSSSASPSDEMVRRSGGRRKT